MGAATTTARPRHAVAWLPLGAMALAQVLLHVITNGSYGMFRDEFYYIACAEHLDWGYVDHPPLSIAMLATSNALFGTSVHAVRILPTLAGGALVLITGMLARELGGGRFAQALAGLAATVAPIYIAMTGFYSMNAFDLLFWSALVYILIRVVDTGDDRLWFAFGAVAGLGLMNKANILALCIGLGGALLLTRHRRASRSECFWRGVALAGVLCLPHILWQVANGWPTLEFVENAQRYKIAAIGPAEFLAEQIVTMHPMAFPLWLAGLVWLLLHPTGRRYRVIGVAYIVVLVFFVVQQSKAYYLAPMYPALLAAGGCAAEGFWQRRRWVWLKPALLGLLLAGGALTAPLAAPLLPAETLVRYQRALGLLPSSGEKHRAAELPQHFADRFGWENMTASVASVYDAMTPERRADCIVIASNYGEAGAINYYGGRYELPRAVSGHNSFYLWGPGDTTQSTAIVVGLGEDELREFFNVVERAATIDSPYAMPYESNVTVHVCAEPRVPLDELWQRLRRYI